MKSNCIKDDVPQLDELKLNQLNIYGMGASVKVDQDAKTKKATAESMSQVYGHDIMKLVLLIAA
jgi:hypothetical protein